MVSNLDTVIFIGFLVANIILGLGSGKGIKTIKEYAVGNRNFSTATIAATIVATWIGGGFFFTTISETYRVGLNAVWAFTASDLIYFLLVSIVFAPRMGEFLGKLSIAEAMGDLFGKRVRIITAISGFIGTCGLISIQLKVTGMLFEYALGISGIFGILTAGIIVTLYSAFGGIRSVVFTDIIQFITFGVVMPTMAYFLLNNLENSSLMVSSLSSNPNFDYREVFDFFQAAPWYYLFLFLYGAVPGFAPAIFQRIAMAKNTEQVSKSFKIAAFTCAFLSIIISAIGVFIFTSNPNLAPNEAAKYIILNQTFVVGFKGLILAGIMAMVMSTIDSYINSTSILIIHDFLKPLGFSFVRYELFSARIASLVIGIISILLSLRNNSLLALVLSAYSFYMPIVTIPFIMAILGFRSTGKSVIIGMAAGAATVLIWNYFDIQAIENVVPAMFANLVFLMGSHYLLKQTGGWVGIKDNAPLIRARAQRKAEFNKLINKVKNLNLFEICKKNYPKGEGLISIFGLFVMVVTFGSVNTLPKFTHDQYAYILDILYPMTLCSSTALISYPLWLPMWKRTNFVGVVWNIIAFSVMICFSYLMVLISDFREVQLTVFLVNIIVISSLVRWQWALFIILFGVILTTSCYKYWIAGGLAYSSILESQAKIVYLVLLIISPLLLFLKPKQQYQELIEETNEHLNSRISLQDEELQKAFAVKSEFLRNITHEYHASLTGVMNSAESLFASYDQLNDKYRKMAAENIYKTAVSLKSLDDNVVTLARICEPDYEFDIKETNFSNLVHERVENCRKYYEDNKDDREFILNIQDVVIANIDTSHMSFALDNLIMNAIKFCPKGKITINLSKTKLGIEFSILDEGIGIPKEEIYDIFDSFKVSSKTWTPAGGRGIGLALCKGIIRKHGGIITAQSDGIRGAAFAINLPE